MERGERQQIALLCLLYLSIDIAESGDPLYVAELCKWHSYGQTRSIGLVLFAKIVFYMHEEDHDQLNREKGMEQPQKEQFFSGLFAIFSVWLEMVQPILGQTEFGLEWGRQNWDRMILSQNGLPQFRPNSVCPRMGCTIPGQNKFVPKWATPYQEET